MQKGKYQKQQTEIMQTVEGCINNERAAQKKLYDIVAPHIYPIAKRYSNNEDDAQHIFNQAIMKIFSSIDKVKGIDAVIPWMKRIAANCAIDFIRQSKRFTDKHYLLEENEEGYEIEGTSINNINDKIEMDEALNTLKGEKPQHHAIFSLYHIYGFNHQEIGDKLKISQELSRYYLKEARKFLQKLFITL